VGIEIVAKNTAVAASAAGNSPGGREFVQTGGLSVFRLAKTVEQADEPVPAAGLV
jgi:hypothetical protein